MSEPTSTAKDSAQAEPAPGRPWRWIVAISVVAVLLFLGGMAINLFTDAPLTISPETTYITEPRTVDGKWVDYVAAVEQRRYPAEMRTDDNGARVIVRALGPGPDRSPAASAQIYEKLGLVLTTSTLKYEEPWKFLGRFVEQQEALGTIPADKTASEWTGELDARMDRPWSLDELPMMGPWLKENGPALDLVAHAVRRPAFCFPYFREEDSTPVFYLDLVDIQRLRAFVRGFAARAHYRLAIGDVDGAIDDVVAAAHLGRRLQIDGFYMELLVGIALESIAHSIGAAASLNHPPSEEQLRRMMDELNSLPARSKFDVFLKNERYGLLDYIQSAAKGDRSDLVGESMQLSRLRDTGLPVEQFGLDWTAIMRHVNVEYENLLKGRASPASPSEWGWLFRGPRSVLLASELVQGHFGSVDAIREAMHKSVCQQRLHRISLAMLLYERQHGTLPPACTVDASGNRLHSWRVLLLPQLGESELFSQIRLDEPWDSPHNRAFHTAADHLYHCPSHGLAPGETMYAVVEGAGAPFDGPVGRTLSDFGPDSADMILVVERTEAANWMNPTREVPLANAKLGINVRGASGVGLGSVHPGGMQAGLRSGGVEFLSENMDLRYLGARLEGRAFEVDPPASRDVIDFSDL
jgi:hypothetical protein